MLTDEQLKNIKTQSEIKRADAKVIAQNQRAAEANKTRADIMREKTQMDASNNRLKVTLEAQNKTVDQQKAQVQDEPLPELRQNLSDINGSSPAPYNIE